MNELYSAPPPPVPGPAPSNPWLIWLVAGVVVGLLAGTGLGWVAFRNSSAVTSKTPTKTPSGGFTPTAKGSPSASPSATAKPSPSATATPTATPTTAPTATATTTTAPTATPAATPAPGCTPGCLSDASFSGCAALAPGQHPLAPVSGSGAGLPGDPHWDWYGCGNVLMPPDYPVFTGNPWELAYSFSCPNADDPGPPGPVAGMEIQAWVYEGGGTPIRNTNDTGHAYLPWSDDAHESMPEGGNYRLKTVLVNNAAPGGVPDAGCRWHIKAFAIAP